MIRFTVGSGSRRHTFDRAPLHTAKWDEQKKGFRLTLGLPPVGNLSSAQSAPSGQVKG